MDGTSPTRQNGKEALPLEIDYHYAGAARRRPGPAADRHERAGVEEAGGSAMSTVGP